VSLDPPETFKTLKKLKAADKAILDFILDNDGPLLDSDLWEINDLREAAKAARTLHTLAVIRANAREVVP
jgi:hypothetical protein